jgi:hypothetical protein
MMSLSAVPDQLVSFDGTTLTNYGTVIWASSTMGGGDSPQIYNYGLWDITTNTYFSGGNGGGGGTTTFNNYGTVRKDGNPSTLAAFDNNTIFNNFGALDIKAGDLAIENGNSISGSVMNTVSNAVTYLDTAYSLSGDVCFTGEGDIYGYLNGNNAVIHGVVTASSTVFTGCLTIASNSVVNLVANFGSPISFNGLTLTNCGTVVWSNLDLDCNSGVEVYNYGLWDALTGNTFYGDANGGFFTSDFNNYGTFRKDGDSSSVNFDDEVNFNNFGTLNAGSGGVSISGGGGNGTFNAASNNVVSLGNFGLFGGSTFTGSGLVAGNLTGTNAVIHGALNFYYGTLQGTLTVASNAVANLAGANGLNTPINLWFLTLTNCGTVVWSNLDLDCEGVQACNYGLWDALTGNTFAGGEFMSVFNNYGTFRKDGDATSTTFDSATTYNNPGKTDVQNGSLVLQGACSLTNGTLNFGISGLSQAGTIYLANTTVLTGRLSANFENHYSPAVSNSFAVVEYSSVTGMFTSLCLPPLSAGLSWQTDYSSTTFSLSIIPTPPPRLSAGLNVSGNSISLSWSGQSGQTYQVQCTTNLAPADWVKLGSSIPGTNGTMTVSDGIGAAQKFYRVEVQ